jgi:hypothetical protein
MIAEKASILIIFYGATDNDSSEDNHFLGYNDI